MVRGRPTPVIVIYETTSLEETLDSSRDSLCSDSNLADMQPSCGSRHKLVARSLLELSPWADVLLAALARVTHPDAFHRADAQSSKGSAYPAGRAFPLIAANSGSR